MTRIINKMYGGNVELVFNPLKHQYTVDDEVVVSVTTALGVLSKPALIYWSANMAAEYVKENIKPGVAMEGHGGEGHIFSIRRCERMHMPLAWCLSEYRNIFIHVYR